MQSRKKLLITLILILLTLVVFWQVIDFDFVGYDDELYVTKNSQVQAGITVEGTIWAFTTFHAGNWHPLTWLSHMLDCEIYGLNPRGHHWTNLQLHLANILLLFFILHQMTRALWRSALVAALFALHPLHVESVVWVAERKDVLSTFFGMLTILAYISYVKRRNIFRYFLVFIFLSLGLMAKPMLVTLPFVLLLLDYWPLGRIANISRIIWEKAPLFVLVAISCVLTLIAQQKVGAVYSIEALPVNTRIANAFVSYAIYIAKTIWPQKLAIFYPHQFGMLSLWNISGSFLLIAGLSFLAIRMLKKYQYVAVGWLWYIGTLVPVIGLLQVGAQGMADRYTYIPLIGLFIIVVWGITDLLKKWHYSKTILAVFAIILISALSTRSYLQAKHWENSAAVFENAIKVTDYNWLAYNNLGLAFMDDGKPEKAVFYYKKALQIKPDYLTALDNIGIAFFKLGKLEESLSYFSEELKINPEHARVHNHIANVLAAQGKLEKAAKHYTKALLLDPEIAGAHNNFANVLAAQGKLKRAILHYELAIKKDSRYADAHSNLANVLRYQGKTDEAAFHFKKALYINPEHADAHFNFGILLINQHKPKEALIHFAETIKIKPDYKQAYNLIGIILLQQGKIEEARKFISKAVQIDPEFSEALKNLEVLNQIKN